MKNPQSQEIISSEQIFRVLWASAIIFHQTSFAGFPILLFKDGFWSGAILDIFTNLCSVAVLINPKRQLSFGLLLVGFISKYAYDLPFVSNHVQLLGLVSIVLLLELLSKKELPIRSLQLATIVAYFYVTIHKLNSGFFSHDGSCANHFGNDVLGSLLPSSLSGPVLNFLPVIVVLTEALLVFLLSVPKWNYLGVVIGFALHFFLGLDLEKRFLNFSALMMALLFLFSSKDFLEIMVARAKQNKILEVLLLLLASPVIRASIAIVLFILQFGLHPQNTEALRLLCFKIIVSIWFIISLVLTTLALLFSRPGKGFSVSKQNISLRTAWLPIGILILGSGPYLGFRTRLSLDMYSNLVVEDGNNNHFFLPSLDLWSYLKDSVEIIDSSDNYLLREYRDQKIKMVGFEFDRYTLSHPLESIEYIRNGKQMNSRNMRQPSISFLANKLLVFRPIQNLDGTVCLW